MEKRQIHIANVTISTGSAKRLPRFFNGAETFFAMMLEL
jgi:hypothetical protein